ncbi:MAG: hypothetical protein ACI4OJ_07795 [Lachnospiraceae bacterium]
MFEHFFHRENKWELEVLEKFRHSALWKALLDPVRLLCGVTLLSLAVGVLLVAYSAAVSSGEDLAAVQAALHSEKLSALFFVLALVGSLSFYLTDFLVRSGIWDRETYGRRIGRMDALLWGCFLGGALGLLLI